ncbi:uncharacterized protein LOC116946588 isoform X2 [Petromyzon marinus]|uniref:uncharacterized protein LOC116946588 isoform X2 n=1 Tax=Petromyzon marinus TaxID=7757 RepID=UPI003F71A598
MPRPAAFVSPVVMFNHRTSTVEGASSRGGEGRCGVVAPQLTPLQQRERTIRELRASLRDAHAHLDDRNQQLQQLKQQLCLLQEKRAQEVTQHTEAELILSAARGELARLGKTVHDLLTSPEPPLDISSISRAARWRASHSSELVQERRRQISPCCRHSCCCSSCGCHHCGCRHCCGTHFRDATGGSGGDETRVEGGAMQSRAGYLCPGGICGGERKCGDGRSAGSERHHTMGGEETCHRFQGKGRDLVLLCGDECHRLDTRGGGVGVFEEVDLTRSTFKPMGGCGEDGVSGSWRPRGKISANGARNGAIAKVGSLLLAPVDVKVLLVAMMVADGDEELKFSHACLSENLADGEIGEIQPRSPIDLPPLESSPAYLSLILKKPGQSDCSYKTMMKLIEGRAMEAPRASCAKWQNGSVTRRLIKQALWLVREACTLPLRSLQEKRPVGRPSVACGQATSTSHGPLDAMQAKDIGHIEMDRDNGEDAFGIERCTRDVEEANGDDRLVVERRTRDVEEADGDDRLVVERCTRDVEEADGDDRLVVERHTRDVEEADGDDRLVVERHTRDVEEADGDDRLVVERHTRDVEEADGDDRLVVKRCTTDVEEADGDDRLVVERHTRDVEEADGDDRLVVERRTRDVEEADGDDRLVVERHTRDVEEADGDDRLVVEKGASRNEEIGEDATNVEVNENDASDIEKRHVIKDIKRDAAAFQDHTTEFERDCEYFENNIKSIEINCQDTEEGATDQEKNNDNIEKDAAGFKIIETDCGSENSKWNAEDIVDTAEFEDDSRDVEEDTTDFDNVEDNTTNFEDEDFEKDVTSLEKAEENIEPCEVVDKGAADIGETTCDAEKAQNNLEDKDNYMDIATCGIEKDKANDFEKGEAIVETAVNVEKGKVMEDARDREQKENIEEGIERDTWDVQEDNRKNTEAVAKQIHVHLDTQDEQVSTFQQTADVEQILSSNITVEKEKPEEDDDMECCMQATVTGHLEPDPTGMVPIQQLSVDCTQDVKQAFNNEAFGSDFLMPSGGRETLSAVLKRGGRSADSDGSIHASAAVPVRGTSTLNEVVRREGGDASSQSAQPPPTSLVMASSSSSADRSNCSDDRSETSLVRLASTDREASVVSLYRRPASEWSRWVALDWLAAGGPMLPGLVVWLACRAQGGDGAWRWIAGGFTWPGQPLACGLMGLLRLCCVLGMSGLRGARREPNDSEKLEPREESESKSRQ